jgi:hypothetical protein
MWRWFSRCFPGISIILLLLLLVFAFPETANWSSSLPWPGRVPTTTTPPPADHGSGKMPAPLSLAQKFFIAYTIMVHVNAQTFVMRLSWALTRAVKETRAVLRRRPSTKTFTGPSGTETPPFADSPASTPISTSPPEPTFFDLGQLEEGEDVEVVHAIILPNYCEDLDTLQTTLNVLASHPRAATQYEVGLERKGTWLGRNPD